MKTRCSTVVIALLLGSFVSVAEAQSFRFLYIFTNSSGGYVNGSVPEASLVLSGNVLYGTAFYGGSGSGGPEGSGTAFAVNTDGSGFTNLHNFNSSSDGANPDAPLVLSGNTLYGTTYAGGSFGIGTVFSVNTDGSGFTNLHNFSGATNDGANPQAGLILSEQVLYGTTSGGGIAGNGTVFAINTNGLGFTNLYSFSAFPSPDYQNGYYDGTNSDGANPKAGLILSGGTLYGTAGLGGSAGYGTVFAVKTNGVEFTNVHNFTSNSTGIYPWAGVILAGNRLYGTTFEGGPADNGTVFAVNTDGSGFTNVHSFSALTYSRFSITNGDGAHPLGGLVSAGNILYGVTSEGGGENSGTVFAINTNGSGFTNLQNIISGNGAPEGGLILSRNTFYGTTADTAQTSAVFAYSLPAPALNIHLTGGMVILSWADAASAFSLQSANSLTAGFTNIPGATSPYTNSITNTQQFFQLMAN